MSNSTTLLDTIQVASSNKEAVANALFDAASPSMLWGRHASTTNLLVWGYYGGTFTVGTTLNAIPNGTVTLTASATNYLQASPTTGAVSANTTGFTSGQIPLYQIVTNATTVTSYTDARTYAPMATAGSGGGSGTVTDIAVSGGVETNLASGADITTTGTIRGTLKSIPLTGTYAPVTTDRGSCYTMSSASAANLNMPTPTSGPTSNFPSGWYVDLQNRGAGATTITVPTGLALDGVTNGTLAVPTNQGCSIFTDGTNWFTLRGIGGSGGGGTYASLTDVSVQPGAGTDEWMPNYNAGTTKWQANPLTFGNSTRGQLDPAHASPVMSFQNNYQAAIVPANIGAASQWQAVRTVGNKTSGKWYAEATVTNFANGVGLGLVNSASPFTVNVPTGQDTNGILLLRNAAGVSSCGAYYNGAMLTSSQPATNVATGQVAAIAVDMINQKVWFWDPAVSLWNNDVIANQNPATNTGGYSISTIMAGGTGALYLALDVLGVGAMITLNTGTTPFNYTIPAGFAPWHAAGRGLIRDSRVYAPTAGQTPMYSAIMSAWFNVGLTLAPAGTISTFDSANHSSGITLSSSLVATNPSSTNWEIVRCTQPQTSGKLYGELTVTAISAGFGFGVMNASQNVLTSGTPIGSGTNGIMMFNHPSSSGIFFNTSTIGSIGTPLPSTGNTVAIAVDLDAMLVWFWNPAAAQWNGDILANQNPATSTGGYALGQIKGSVPGALYLGANMIGAGASVTYNGGSSPFVNDIPFGFSPWSAIQPGALSDVNITAPQDGQVQVFNAASGQWVNVPAPDGEGFVDGNFDQWNVNTTFSLAAATDTYTADMWICNAGTGGAATVSQNVATLGSEPAGMTRGRKYQLKYQQTTNASASPTVGQKLESVAQYNGQSVTLSVFLAAAAAATDVVGVKYTQNFGTGGSPSSSVTATTTVAWALTTTEQKYSVRLDIPSITGKTLGTGGNDFLRIDLLLATGATYTVYHSQFQLDVCPATASSNTTGTGGVPQKFRYAGIGPEAVRAQRFLQKVMGAPFYTIGATLNATNCYTSTNWIQPFRGVPAVTSSAASAFLVSTPAGNLVPSALSLAATATILNVTATVSGATAGQAAVFQGSGTFIMGDARL